jgi:phage regulator Rha-like protein
VFNIRFIDEYREMPESRETIAKIKAMLADYDRKYQPLE